MRQIVVLALAAILGVPAAAEVVVGQIVCSACWTEADRSRVSYGGEADLACAARCAADGVPPAIAVRDPDGSFRLLIVRGGPPAVHRTWLDLIGSFVKAEVTPSGEGVQVTALELLPQSPWNLPETESEPRSWLDLGSTRQSLDALRGRVVVLNFWATWCKPCVEELPILQAVQNDYGALGVQVVGIAADDAASREHVLEFARRAKIGFPVWLGATAEDMAAFGVGPALPATVVLDRSGRVVHRVSGVVKGRALREVLDAVALGSTGSTPAADVAQSRPASEASLVPS